MDNENSTPLHAASHSGYVEVIDLLVSNYAPFRRNERREAIPVGYVVSIMMTMDEYSQRKQIKRQFIR